VSPSIRADRNAFSATESLEDSVIMVGSKCPTFLPLSRRPIRPTSYRRGDVRLSSYLCFLSFLMRASLAGLSRIETGFIDPFTRSQTTSPLDAE